MQNTISILGGAIIINKAKMDKAVSVFSYGALYIARILLLIATGLFLFATIVAAGDSRIDDGNPYTVLVTFSVALLCILCAGLTTIFMKMVLNGYKIRCKKREQVRANGYKQKIAS